MENHQRNEEYLQDEQSRSPGVIAHYKKQVVRPYQGNPCNEALPDILSEEQAVQSMAYFPEYDPEERKAPAHIRYHLIENALNFFTPLKIHVELEQRISRLIRSGYVARNPLSFGYYSGLTDRLEVIGTDFKPGGKPLGKSACGMAIVGMSGMGKTTGIDRVTSLYPQVIHHSEYQGKRLTMSQVAWLKLQCPHDGSIRNLCVNFFREMDRVLGTNYHKSYEKSRTTTDAMIPEMARVASLHCLGLLIIDEIQHLNAAASVGAAKMLNFFVQLINSIHLPTILIGTYGAMTTLQLHKKCEGLIGKELKSGLLLG